MERIYRQLGELARRYGAQNLVLFGSWARGDFHEHSDIGLAVFMECPRKIGPPSGWMQRSFQRS